MKHSLVLIENNPGDAPLVPEVEKPRKNNAVILLVEDEPSVRRLTERVLMREGYTVLSAKDGNEAAAIAAGRDEIDLLIADVVMPCVSGPEVAALLRKKWHSLRVLFMSGYTEDTISDRGVPREGLQFLGKPFTPTQLASKVADIISSATLVAA